VGLLVAKTGNFRTQKLAFSGPQGSRLSQELIGGDHDDGEWLEVVIWNGQLLPGFHEKLTLSKPVRSRIVFAELCGKNAKSDPWRRCRSILLPLRPSGYAPAERNSILAETDIRLPLEVTGPYGFLTSSHRRDHQDRVELASLREKQIKSRPSII